MEQSAQYSGMVMENKRTHLGMIQGIVNRLAQNSFALKGWSVALVSALFVLAANSSNRYFVYLAYFPAIAFWILDGYFLWQERLFRALYDKVRGLKEDDIDFSMDISQLIVKNKSWKDAILSTTLIIFHGVVIGSIVIVMFLII
jgi:hypothetical protein